MACRPARPERDVQAARYYTGLSGPGRCCAAMSTPPGNCAGMSAPVGDGAGLSAPDCAGVSKCCYERTAQPGTAPPPQLKTAPDSTAPGGSAPDRDVTPRSAPDRNCTAMSAPVGTSADLSAPDRAAACSAGFTRAHE